jgi:hypothetical protein
MDSGLNFALQQLGPALDGIMKALSLLGQEDFFMILCRSFTGASIRSGACVC